MNFDGEFIKEWPSIKRAADSFGKSTASIWCALKGTRKNNAHGFSWKYK